MYSSRGGSNQDPGLAQKTIAGLAVAEAGRLVKNYFKKVTASITVVSSDF
jgi:hypothetical protein